MSLKDIIFATQADLRAKAELARVTFAVDSRQVEGLRSEAKIRQFTVAVDAPPSFGGGDAGPSPVELVLAALAASQELTYRAFASALDVPLDSVSVKLEGTLDIRGFFAVNDEARPGFVGVRGVVELKSPAPASELERLKAVVEAHCPVLDALRAPTAVEFRLAAVESAPRAE